MVPMYTIGLDIGTSAVKGVLLSSGGDVSSRAREETRYLPSPDGYVQFDANQLYEAVTGVIRSLVAALPAGGSVAGISLASASGNTVLVNEQGEPMLPAFSWMDSRLQGEMEPVFGQLDGGTVHDLVGWPLIPQFPLAHLSWLKCHEPQLIPQSAKICMSTDYINFRLTGNWGIDNSTATTFYLQDQKAAEWHPPFLQKLGISAAQLPPIHQPGTVLGAIAPRAAAETALPPGCPVVLGSFDHPSAARGAGILKEGELLLSCGTSWVGFLPVADRTKALAAGMLIDPFLQPEGPWGAMFSLPAIAATVDKYINRYISTGPRRYIDFSRLSAAAKTGAGGLLLNPLQDDLLNGELREIAKADIARALMEGTAFLLKRQLERLEAAGWHFAAATMVGGPSETHPWPQIVADVLGWKIGTINGSCAGAVGAAMLAGKGVGIYEGEEEAFRVLNFPKLEREPDQAAHQAYREIYSAFQLKYS